MIVTTLNRRYAKSLIGLAIERGALEDVKKDMAHVLETITSSRDLRLLLKSPVVNTDKKEAILEELFSKSVGELTYGFIKIILDKGRESQLQGIALGFENLYRVHKGIEEAVVTTAHALTDAQKADISAKLKALTGSAIEIKENIDPSLIGGVRIRVGDKQYNGSIAYQLAQLRRQFQRNTYVADF